MAIYGELTARENLLFFGELYNLGGASLQRRVEEILAAVGLARPAAAELSTLLISLLQGAHVLCRAAGTVEPFERAARAVVALVPGDVAE